MDWSSIPSLAALRAFEAAARLGGFSPAARELNVTPAAIAHHVRALEAELGAGLLRREGRGLAATVEGRTLADGLTDGFATIGDTIARLRADEEGRALGLAVTPAFASNWLMPRIGDFWHRHADIQVNILPSVDVVDLRTDGVDMAVRYGDGDWPGLEVELLTDGDFWVVAHPRLLGGARPSCVADVAHLPWLLEHYMMERRAMIEGAGLSLDEVRVQKMGTNALSLAGAEAGLGVAVQAKSLVERQVAAGTLVKICEMREEPLGYYMVALPGRRTDNLRHLRRWLRRQVARG